MKKSESITIVAVIIIAIIAIVGIVGIVAIVGPFNKKDEGKGESKSVSTASNLDSINSAEDLSNLIDKIYEGQENLLPSLQTQKVDVSDTETVQYVTGLENTDDLQFVVVSEPMMSSQAYSLILVKVKDGVNANEVAKKMKDGVDTRKWICVTAEKVYATNSGNIVCLVMASEERAKPIFEKFKTLAGTVGDEYERTEKVVELPDDMLVQ